MIDRNLGRFERWSLPQTLNWIATRQELAQRDEFHLETCEMAWPTLAAALATGKLRGIGSKVGNAIGSMSMRVEKLESGLQFPPPESPGFPLTAQLIGRTDQKGKVWLDVCDSGNRRRMRMLLGAQWWSDISFLKADILSEFPANPARRGALDDCYDLPADEPPGGREAARAYHALKQKYGTKVPKRSTQWLATNLPGNHSRDSIARALGKKK
jgi:hypothetical protein